MIPIGQRVVIESKRRPDLSGLSGTVVVSYARTGRCVVNIDDVADFIPPRTELVAEAELRERNVNLWEEL